MNLTGNTILITGGTSGIGLELVKQFYARNNKIIVASRSLENLQKLKTDFPEIDFIVCDLADSSSVKNLINICLAKHQDINILINNAGIQHNYSWTEKENHFNKIEQEIAINLTSPLQLSYGLWPLLFKKKQAAIINISSALAIAPKRDAIVYCATKSAIQNATKALRYQLENTPVKVFEIIPPLVDTRMTDGRGKDKLSPKELVDVSMPKLKRGKNEIYIGKAKLLKMVNRLSPRLAHKIMKKG